MSAVRRSLIRFSFFAVLLVIGASAEDILPRVCGVGVPVLLCLSLAVARRGTWAESAIFAVAAGAMADAIGSLPMAASASCFLTLAWLVRRADAFCVVAAFAYPAYLLWLWAWTGSTGGEIFWRTAMAMPLGLASALLVGAVCDAAGKGAAIDEAG